MRQPIRVQFIPRGEWFSCLQLLKCTRLVSVTRRLNYTGVCETKHSCDLEWDIQGHPFKQTQVYGLMFDGGVIWNCDHGFLQT